MELEIIGIFVFFFGVLFTVLSKPFRKKDRVFVHQIFLWIGIILDVIGLLMLVPWVIDVFAGNLGNSTAN